jgi:hypothetical protein
MGDLFALIVGILLMISPLKMMIRAIRTRKDEDTALRKTSLSPETTLLKYTDDNLGDETGLDEAEAV